MRVFVTGATGGLGRNAVSKLLEHGHEVTASGRNQEVLAQLQCARKVRVDLSKVLDSEAREMVAGHDAVWHCAALSSPRGRPDEFFAANVTASSALFEASARESVPVFVHISTPAVYFDFTNRFAVREDQVAAEPVNDYAKTKLQAELNLLSMAKRFPKTKLVVLRPRAIFGPHDQVLLPRLLSLHSARRGKLALPNGGRAVLDLTFVDNVVHAMMLATQADVASGSVFNITNGEPWSVRDVLERLVRDELGQSIEIKSAPYSVLGPVCRVLESLARLTNTEPRFTRYSLGALAFSMTLDISAARKELGYEPVVSMEDGIRRTAAWLRSSRGG